MAQEKQPKNKKKRIKKSTYNLDDMPSSNMKMKYFKKKREQKRIKNKIFQMHFFVKICSIFAILWFCSKLMVCHYWYLPQTAFNSYPNKNLKIIGNRITTNDKILSALKTQPIPNKPIYLINTSKYEKEIEKLSPVKKAFVRRYWLPARFEVTIEEEIPVLTIAPNPKAPEIAAITLNKKIISKDYLPIDAKKYITYKILTYDDYTKWDSKEIKSLEILSQRIEDFSGEKLLYLDIRNKKDVFARLETIKIRIGELNSTLKERIERLSSIMPQIENLKNQTDYVDIRWDNTTYLKKRSKDYVPDEYVPNPYQKDEEKENTSTEKKSVNQNEKDNSSLDKVQPKKVESSKQNTSANKVETKKTVPTKQNIAVKKVETQNNKKQVTQASTSVKSVAKPTSKPVNTKKELDKLPAIDIQIVEP